MSFETAYDKMIIDEGGYILHTIPGDAGGTTYAGIARNKNPQWEGWTFIDNKETPPTELVREFYKVNFWDRIKGDELNPAIAQSIFNFGVNAGVSVAVKLAQIVAKTAPDGVIGAKTISALNGMSEELFVAHYALAKIARYRDIVQRDRTQIKFMLGWLNRALRL
jgi:lysozyme family protein